MFHRSGKKQKIRNSKDAVSVLIQLIEEEKLDLASIFSNTIEKISPKKNAPRVFTSSINDEIPIDEINALEKFNNIRKSLLQIDPLPRHHSKFAENLLTKAVEETLESNPEARDIIAAIFEDPKVAFTFSVNDKNIVNEFINKLNVKTPVEQYNQLLKKISTFHFPLIDTASNTEFAKKAINTLLSNTQKNIDALTEEDLENLALHQSIEIINPLKKNLAHYLEEYRKHDENDARFQYSYFEASDFENTVENDQKAFELLTEVVNKMQAMYGEELSGNVFEQIINGKLPSAALDDQYKIERRGILEILSKQFAGPAITRSSKPDLYTNFLSNFLVKYKYATRDEEVDLLKNLSQIIAARQTKKNELETATSLNAALEQNKELFSYQRNMYDYLENTFRSTENLFIEMMQELQRIRFVENAEGEPRLELDTDNSFEEEDISDLQVATSSPAPASSINSDYDDATQKSKLKVQNRKPNQFDEMKETNSFEDFQEEVERSYPITKDKPREPGERLRFNDEPEAPTAKSRDVFSEIQRNIKQARGNKAQQQSEELDQGKQFSTAKELNPIEIDDIEQTTPAQSTPSDIQILLARVRNLGQDLPDDFLTRSTKNPLTSLQDDLQDDEASSGLAIEPAAASSSVNRPTINPEAPYLSMAPETDNEEVEIKSELGGQSEENPAPKIESTFRALYNHIYLYVFEFLPKPYTKEIEILKELISACREEAKNPDLMKQALNQLNFYKEHINKTGSFDLSNMKDLEKLKQLILKESQNYLPKKEVSKSSWRTLHLWKWKEKVADKTKPSKVAGLISIINNINEANSAEDTLFGNEWLAFKFLKLMPELLKEIEFKNNTEDQAQEQLLMMFKDFLINIWKNELPSMRDEAAEVYEKRLQIKATSFVENIKDQLPSNRIIYLRHISLQLLQSLELIYAIAYDEAHPNKNLFRELKQKILAIDNSVINAPTSANEIVAQLQDAMKQLGHDIKVELNPEENDISPIKLKRNSTEDRRLRLLTSTATYLLQNVNDLIKQDRQVSSQLTPLKQIVQQNMRAILELKLPEQKEKFNFLLKTIKDNAIQLCDKISSVLQNENVSFAPLSPWSVFSNSKANSTSVKRQEASVNSIKSVPPTTPPSPTRK